jgi:hypothetical protein
LAYTIKTPNEKYNGVTEGVGFVNGVAKVEDKQLRDVLVNNYGYSDVTEKKAEEKPADKAPAKKASDK